MQIHPPKQKLTTREREILASILADKKRKDIATDLHISENTVKTHTAHIFDKFGVFNRQELFDILNGEN